MRTFIVDDHATTSVRTTDAPENQASSNIVHPLPSVLLVDDDSFILETTSELLEMEGYRVLQAIDAQTALTHLTTEEIDILVTDLSMPGSDGITLIRQGRSMRRNLPAILMTGYAEEGAQVGGSGDTSYHILRKPVEINLLLERIKVLLTQQSALVCAAED